MGDRNPKEKSKGISYDENLDNFIEEEITEDIHMEDTHTKFPQVPLNAQDPDTALKEEQIIEEVIIQEDDDIISDYDEPPSKAPTPIRKSPTLSGKSLR